MPTILRVRKLTGKPAFLTIADCESEARRIHSRHEQRFTPYAAESKVFRTHSDSDNPERFTAPAIGLYSSGENLAWTRIARSLDFGTFGLPILGFINYFPYDEILVDRRYLLSYDKSTIKDAMANDLPIEKKVAVISMLCEGASMCAVSRITGIHGDTIGRLALRVGEACKKIMDEKMRGLSCKQIEVDEIWGFIGAKQKNARRSGQYGDVWTFIALDADTKLIPSFVVGKRDAYHAKTFMSDLASRVKNRVQISSDALKAYEEAVERGFGSEVDYGQIVKTYSVCVPGSAPAAVRYSPAEVVQVEKTVVSGMPNVNRITTSHVEKQNHTLRMHCRRLTRLTNAFSKKFENFEAAVALNFAYYNFCKTHKALRMTPAMAAGIENTHWTVEDLVKRCGE